MTAKYVHLAPEHNQAAVERLDSVAAPVIKSDLAAKRLIDLHGKHYATAWVLCISFGSLSWLRPGNVTDDPLRFSRHAAAFNTTGFTRNRRFWHTPGVIGMNVGPHPRSVFRPGNYESGGMEKRGEWNRVLLNRCLPDTKKPDRILFCVQSRTVGRIDFGSNWCTNDVLIVAGSAFRGDQETLILAQPGAQLKTERGNWEVTWTGLLKN